MEMRDDTNTHSNSTSGNSKKNITGRRKFIIAAGSTGLATLAGCIGGGNGSGSGSSNSNSSVQWDLATGSQGGSSYVIGSTLSSFMQQEAQTNGVQLSAVETSGTLASYRRFDQGQYEMSGTNGGFLANSPDQGPFQDQPLNNFNKIRQMRTYFTAHSFFVTKKKSNIESFSDLEGETVLVCPSGSGLRPLAEYILDQTVGMGNIKPQYSSWDDVPTRLQSDQVTAASVFIVNNVVPTSHVQQLDSVVDWKPIQFPQSLRNAIEDYAGNTYRQINTSEWASKYTGSVDTFTSPYIYVAMSDNSNKAAYEITRITFEHAEALANRNRLLSLFPNEEDSMGFMSSDVPIHQGAYRYFKEAGIWSDYDLKKPPEAEN